MGAAYLGLTSRCIPRQKIPVRRRSKDSKPAASSDEENSALLAKGRGADANTGGGGKKRGSSRSAIRDADSSRRDLDASDRRHIDSSDRRRGLDSSDRRRSRKKGAVVNPNSNPSASDSEGSSLLGFMPRDEFLVRQQQQQQQQQQTSDRSIVEGSGPQKSAPWAARMLKKKKSSRSGRSADKALQRSGHDDEGERSAGEKSPGEKSPSEKSPGEKSPGEKSPGEKSPGERSPGERDGDKAEPAKQRGPSRHADRDATERQNREKLAQKAQAPQGGERKTAEGGGDRGPAAHPRKGQRKNGDINASERAPASDRMLSASEHRMASASEHGAAAGRGHPAVPVQARGRVHPPGGRVPPQGPPLNWRERSRRSSFDYSGHSSRDASGHGPGVPPFNGGRGDGPMFVRGPKGRPTLVSFLLTGCCWPIAGHEYRGFGLVNIRSDVDIIASP